MKKYFLGLAVCIVLTACENSDDSEENNEEFQNNSNNELENNNGNDNNAAENNEENEAEDTSVVEADLHDFDDYDEAFVSAEQLADLLEGTYDYDPVDKTLTMTVSGREFYLIYDVPVLEVEGEYIAADDIFIIEDDQEEPYITKAFIEKGLETEYSTDEQDESISFNWDEEVIEAWQPAGQEDMDFHEFTTDEMVDFLSFLERPIEGASVSTVESHLPGAPRDYRNGYHEGIDWYDYASGTEITTDTSIYAMAEGTVVRVDDDFEDYPSHEVRNEELAIAAEVGFTPEYILDRLRGKQVWVQYENGVMNRFAHLDSIPEELELGESVNEQTIIGYVGNTGTSGALDGDGSGLHLHQDLLIYGEFFWEPFTLEETTYILQELWQ